MRDDCEKQLLIGPAFILCLTGRIQPASKRVCMLTAKHTLSVSAASPTPDSVSSGGSALERQTVHPEGLI